MQLILDAENSEINIREKMTTVEDSICKLTNGIETEKAPEKEIESKPEKENSVNGDIVIESEKNIEEADKTVLQNVPEAPCADEDVSQNSNNKCNGDNHTTLDCSESTSKNESNGESRVDITEINIDRNKNETLKESHNEAHNNEDVFGEKVIDELENPSEQRNDENKLETREPVENFNQKSNENVNTDDCKEDNIENNLETEKPVENTSCINDIIKPDDDEENLDTQGPDEKVNEPNKENEHFESNIAVSNAEPSEMKEAENIKEQEKKNADSGDSGLNVDNYSIVSKDNEEVQSSSTENCNNVVIEPYLDSEKTEMSETSENTASHIQTPVSSVDNTETSVKTPINESCDEGEADMDCDVTPISLQTPEESASTPMDCDNLDLIENDKNKTVTDHEEINETVVQEKTQVDQRNSLAVESVNEVSFKENNEISMDHDAINEADVAEVDKTATLATEAVKEEVEKVKDSILNKTIEKKEVTPAISVPAVIQEIETTVEDVTKDKKTSENAVEEKETSSLEEIKEIVVQETIENSVALTASSPSKEVHSDIEKVKIIDIDMEDKSTKSPIKANLEEVKEFVVQETIENSVALTASSPNKEVHSDIEKVKIIDIDMEDKSTKSQSKVNLEEVKEFVVQETIENSVALTASSPSKEVHSNIEEVKVIDIDMEDKSTKSPSKANLEEIKEMVVQETIENSVAMTASSPSKEVLSDIEEVKVIDIDMEDKSTKSPSKANVEKPTPSVCKLSNTLNILSDDEDEPLKKEVIPENIAETNDKQCINIEDDDDVMVIEDTATQDKPESISSECTSDKKDDLKSDSDSGDAKTCEVITEPEAKCNNEKESSESKIESVDSPTPQITEKDTQEPVEEKLKEKPLLPKDIFKSYRKNLSEMTRDDLEEFCIVKIVESIIDRSSLNEIKTRLKTMSQTLEEYKKKALIVTKQNRDLQVVLKSVQEEQKKGGDTPIVPLKITRSVGMQVLMTDKNVRRKANPTPATPAPAALKANNRVGRVYQNPRHQAPVTNQQIPVPRLVPAPSAAPKSNPVQAPAPRTTAKPINALSNGVKSSPPVPKVAEKRTRVQSVTVDLTDDEPPPKIPANKSSPVPPVRLVPSQNLMAPRAQMASNTLNSPRKVYIPISSNQNQRPSLMMKNIPSAAGPRPRGAAPMGPRAQIRPPRTNSGRHPAPLPDAVKQYQPPNWKDLPPAPDLKLSKVENGIVISWKIDGYQEDSYEEIASYQLYAYQETAAPPQTSQWKKIGDVKALPLPMACTLTQFMAGYKYYFAVRAVDVRSRLGPFSLPGSILLLNKM